MDLEREISKLEKEVRAIKVAMAQAGTNIRFVRQTKPLSYNVWFGPVHLDTRDGGPVIAFKNDFCRRIPSSSGGVWYVYGWNGGRDLITMKEVAVWATPDV